MLMFIINFPDFNGRTVSNYLIESKSSLAIGLPMNQTEGPIISDEEIRSKKKELAELQKKLDELEQHAVKRRKEELIEQIKNELVVLMVTFSYLIEILRISLAH